ncbi:hypothetical protein [Aliivibrio finisterrensis]|uniref:Uncharacterized protein n=1 Tax=Aliivibrio finisterrensis TaxID=511998 RepID=A0A6N6RTT8_9GAMM|nr:hypothetical protein [Aliivibrio finisterrensis]KAB2825053.1 hypothetical protein F8B77_07330 [Aliivibrio finisterrensis]
MDLKKSLLLGTMIAATSFLTVAADSSKMKAPEDITCAGLIDQDYSLVPVTIGYIVSAHNITEIDALEPVEIDDIVAECQKASNKNKKVSAVAKKEVKDD